MPETYTSKSLELIRQHISQHFGEAEYFMQMYLDNGFLVEVDVVRPTPYRNFYTLVTVGLGAYLNPDALADGCVERCELTFYLPADWQRDDGDWSADNRNWPIDLLKRFIEMVVEQGVGLNTLVDNGVPFGNNTRQKLATLIRQVEPEMNLCLTADDQLVEFLSVFVLYDEEAEYMRQHGPEKLMQAIDDDLEIIQVAPLCLARKNVLAPDNKKYWLTHESPILTDWPDGPYCYASDRIMVEGQPIAYFFRVEPDEADSLGWDSGWRFLAEGDVLDYTIGPKNKPDNIGNFELNTLCNVDGRILPFLRAPFGSAYHCHENGSFVFNPEGVPAPIQPSLLTDEVRQKLETFVNGQSADFLELIGYLREFVYKGNEAGRFNIEQARSNLELSLWYAYACINTDSYEMCYEAAALMPFAENYALGCGRWYYRYALALIYCGELKKALRYAEFGTEQEHDYPWNYLLIAKLRAHFGLVDEALKAVEEGLRLVPDDYEFLTLQREVGRGATLEEMMYHVIDPEADQRLQDGSLPGTEEKKRLIAGITCNQKALAQVKAMFHPMADWAPNAPYCTFTWNVLPEEPLVIGFSMGEAALSKMNLGWLWQVREKLDGTKYRRQLDKSGEETRLVTVMIDWNQHIDLIYQYPDSNKLLRVGMKV